MKMTPKTEKQLVEENLWPAGSYDFTIADAEDAVSKNSGADMVKLTLTVFNADLRKRNITDYLLDSMAWKLRHFAFAVGLGAEYESGNMPAASMIGRSGKVLLKVEEQAGYMPKNAVKDYVVVKEGEAAPAQVKAAAASGASLESEPPF